MATFVIVHGAWGGGWEWTPVARMLRERGHDVFTPTLTGLGERAHLATDSTDLGDHVRDILAVLEYEALDDIILCGHSYGGMVVTGAADRAPDRIRLLVYLDAFVPRDGQSLVDLLPAEFGEAIFSGAPAGSSAIPLPAALYPPEGVVADQLRADYLARVRPHPAATLTHPLHITGAVERIPRAYVRCTSEEDPVLDGLVSRARRDGWLYREIPTAHDLQLLAPDETAAVLDELASAVTVAGRDAGTGSRS